MLCVWKNEICFTVFCNIKLRNLVFNFKKRNWHWYLHSQTSYRYKYSYTFNQDSLGKIRPPNKWTQHLIIHTVLCIVEEASINNCSRNAENVVPPQSQCPLQLSSMPTPKSWSWLLSYWYVNNFSQDGIQIWFKEIFKII
jgi:hypothetical protein